MPGTYVMTASGRLPAQTVPGEGEAGIGALATRFHYPAAETEYTPGTSLGDLDATYASATFTAPDSGEVWVMFSGPTVMQQAQSGLTFALREGSTEVPNTRHRGEYLSASTAVTNQIRLAPVVFHVVGLTPGSEHTYKIAWMKFGVGATATTLKAGDPTSSAWGGLHMVVSASPLV